jgi:subtilisin
MFSKDPVLGRLEVRVIDSVHEDGPKLVEMSQQSAESLESMEPGLRVFPLQTYRLAAARIAALGQPPGASSGAAIRVRIVCSVTGKGLAGARVSALTNVAAWQGDEAVSDAYGDVLLRLGGGSVAIEKLYVQPPPSGYWGAYRPSGLISLGDVVPLEPISALSPNVLTHFYGAAPPRPSSEIIVGVIDAGVGPHGDLNLIGGANTVQGEPRGDIGDNGIGHGTHVAGIVGGDGGTAKGVAPGVKLRSYRIFGRGKFETNNYSIAKALIYAVDDGCDIVNLSLTGEQRPDPTLDEALKDAMRQGTLVVIAAGNEFRKPIGYPAAYVDQTGLVVSAMGRKSFYPAGSCEIDALVGRDPEDFVAPFTNIGPPTNSGAQISVIAPGIGVISTVPGGYGVMSGTSMAAPAVCGFAARLLTQDLSSANPVLRKFRDRQRVLDMIQMVDGAAKSLGFGRQYEGRGLPS